MSSMIFEMLIVVLLIVGNGFFAMSEIALISARKSRLQQWANEGNAQARSALELANVPTQFLSTVQIGITLVGTLAGAFGGVTIAGRLAGQLDRVAWLAPYGHAVSVVIVVVGITYLTLVVGELAPKRLALQNPERVACAVAGLMRTLSRVTHPVVRLLGASTEVVLRLLGSQPSSEPHVTSEEIEVLMEQATQAGVFQEREQDMVEGVLHLNNRRVSALATPRTDIVWLALDATREEIREQVATSAHDRFPVCEGNLDNVVGVVRTGDMLAHCLASGAIDLRALSRPPLFVPETMFASKALELLKQSVVHLAFVMDEYGGLQGMVTINDIVEEIVGDIETDRPRATRRKDGTWLIDGMLPIHDFKELFNLKRLPGEERDNYQTVGGFVMMRLGHIPQTTDQFRWGGLRFEVLDMDERRVDKVLVSQLKPENTEVPAPPPKQPISPA